MKQYRVYSDQHIVVETPDRSVALRAWSNVTAGKTVAIFYGAERMPRLVRIPDGRVHQRIDL